MVEVELPTSLEDVDHLWDASFNALAFKPPPEKEDRDPVTRQADEDRNSRTNLILAWFGTNMYVLHSGWVLSLTHGCMTELSS